MRHLFVFILAIFICGCRSESRRDTYLAAVDRYIASLESAAKKGEPIDPPPQPSYLICPVQPEQLPCVGHAQGGLSSDTMRNTYALRKLSMCSQAQCEQTNTARKEAYTKALQRYMRVVSGGAD